MFKPLEYVDHHCWTSQVQWTLSHPGKSSLLRILSSHSSREGRLGNLYPPPAAIHKSAHYTLNKAVQLTEQVTDSLGKCLLEADVEKILRQIRSENPIKQLVSILQEDQSQKKNGEGMTTTVPRKPKDRHQSPGGKNHRETGRCTLGSGLRRRVTPSGKMVISRQIQNEDTVKIRG